MSLIWIAFLGVFYYFWDASVRFFCRRNIANIDKRQILFVRPDSVGDFIVWLDAARHLRSVFPATKFNLSLIGSREWAELAKKFDYWDVVIEVDRRKFLYHPLYRWSFLRMIYHHNYDCVIHPVFSRFLLVGDAMVRSSAARKRIGWEIYRDLNSPFFFNWKKRITESWYTRRVPLDRRRLGEQEKNIQFLGDLGLNNIAPSIPRLPKDMLPPHGFNLPANYFVVVPDALWEGREWPLSRFWTVAEDLWRKTGWTAVFLGVRREVAVQLKAVIDHGKAVDLIGRTSLMQYLAIISGARLVIGNESSAIHAANALDIPAVTIAGGGHWGRFVPYIHEGTDRRPVVVHEYMECYCCDWQCKYPSDKGPVLCIDRIAIKEVTQAIESAIREGNGHT